MQIRIQATANLGQAEAQFAALQAQVDKLNASLARTAMVPTGGSVKGFTQATSAARGAERQFANALAASGAFRAEQVRLPSVINKTTEALSKQKLTFSQVFGKGARDNMRAVYKEQLAMQQAFARQTTGTVGSGRTQMTMAVPSEVPKSWDNLSNRVGFFQARLKSASVQMINWGKQMQWSGRQLMTGLTLPVAAFGAAAGVMAYQVNKQFTRIQKVYDTTADANSTMVSDMKAYSKEIGELQAASFNTASDAAKQYGVSITDTLSVQADLAATGQKGAALQAATTQVVRNATLGEIEYQTATSATIALQQQLHLSNTELADSWAYMNSVENATSLGMADFAEAIPIALAPIRQMGGDLQDLGTLMTAMVSQGVQVGKAANAIKALPQRLSNPAKTTQELFKKLTGQDIVELNKKNPDNIIGLLQAIGNATKDLDIVAKRQVLSKLFGSYQLSTMSAMLGGVEDLADGIGQTTDAFKIGQQSAEDWRKVSDREIKAFQDSSAGKFKIAFQSIKAELAGIGDPFLDVASKFLDFGTALFKFFNGLPGIVKKAIILPIFLGAILGPIVMLAGLFVQLAGNVGKMFAATLRLAKGMDVLTIAEHATAFEAKLVEKGFVSQQSEAQLLTARMEALTAATEAQAAAMEQMYASTNKAAGAMGGMRSLPIVKAYPNTPATAAQIQQSVQQAMAQQGVKTNASGQSYWGAGSGKSGFAAKAQVEAIRLETEATVKAQYALAEAHMKTLGFVSLEVENAEKINVAQKFRLDEEKMLTAEREKQAALAQQTRLSDQRAAAAKAQQGTTVMTLAQSKEAEKMAAAEKARTEAAQKRVVIGQAESKITQTTARAMNGAAVGSAAMATSMGLMMLTSNETANNIGQFLMIATIAIPALKLMGPMIASIGTSFVKAATAAKAATLATMGTGRAAVGAAGAVGTMRAGMLGVKAAALAIMGPVGWIVTAVAAIGFGAYKLWQHEKEITKEKRAQANAMYDQKTLLQDSLDIQEKQKQKLSVTGQQYTDAGLPNVGDLAKDMKDNKEYKDLINDLKSDDTMQTEKDAIAMTKYRDIIASTGGTAEKAQLYLEAMFRAAGDGALEAQRKAADYANQLGTSFGDSDLTELWSKQINSIFNDEDFKSIEEQGDNLGKDLANAIAEGGHANAQKNLDTFMEVYSKGLPKEFAKLDSDTQAQLEKFGINTGQKLMDAIAAYTSKQGGSTEGFLNSIGLEKGTMEATQFSDIMYQLVQPNGPFGQLNSMQTGIVTQLAEQLGIEGDITTFKQLQATWEWKLATATQDNAKALYDQKISHAGLLGTSIGVTDEQKLQIANQILANAGLGTAKTMANALWILTGKAADATGDAADEAKRLKNNLGGISFTISADQAKTALQNTFKAVQSQMAGMASDQLEAEATASADAVAAYWDKRGDQLERAQDAQSKRLEARQQAAQDRFDAMQQNAEDKFDAAQEKAQRKFDRRQENEQERFDKRWDRRKNQIQKASDARIAGIQKEIDAEQAADDARQAMFEAEQKRIDRLAESANKGIDFNIALSTGDIDQAAKLQNDIAATAGTWAVEDNKSASDKASQAKIDALNKTADAIKAQTDVELAELDKAEAAATKSFQRRQEKAQRHFQRMQELEQRAFQKSQEMEQRRFDKSQELQTESLQRAQDRAKKMLEQQTAAAKAANAAEYAARKASLDAQLALFTAFTVSSKAQLDKWMAKTGLAYSDFGIKSGDWFNKAFKQQLRTEGASLGSDSMWAALGNDVAKQTIKGMGFGGLKGFANFIKTGVLPDNFGKTKPPTGNQYGAGNPDKPHAPVPGSGAHEGGWAGKTGMNRKGVARTTKGLHPSETLVRAQKGEFIVNRRAAAEHGSTLEAINSGKMNNSRSNIGDGKGGSGPNVGLGGFAAGMAGAAIAAGGANALRVAFANKLGTLSTPSPTGANIPTIIGKGGKHAPSIPGKGWYGGTSNHDYLNGLGSPIYAFNDGIISKSKAITSGGSPGNGLYGNKYTSYGEVIEVTAADGNSVLSAHMKPGTSSRWNVGQQVTGGTLLGLSDMTGNASGPHTHFEHNGDENDARPFFNRYGISLDTAVGPVGRVGAGAGGAVEDAGVDPGGAWTYGDLPGQEGYDPYTAMNEWIEAQAEARAAALAAQATTDRQAAKAARKAERGRLEGVIDAEQASLDGQNAYIQRLKQQPWPDKDKIDAAQKSRNQTKKKLEAAQAALEAWKAANKAIEDAEDAAAKPGKKNKGGASVRTGTYNMLFSSPNSGTQSDLTKLFNMADVLSLTEFSGEKQKLAPWINSKGWGIEGTGDSVVAYNKSKYSATGTGKVQLNRTEGQALDGSIGTGGARRVDAAYTRLTGPNGEKFWQVAAHTIAHIWKNPTLNRKVQQEQFASLGSLGTRLGKNGLPVFIGGDLNNDPRDIEGSRPGGRQGMGNFSPLTNAGFNTNWTAAAMAANPNGTMGGRFIDHVFSNAVAKLISTKAVGGLTSDHNASISEFSLPSLAKGAENIQWDNTLVNMHKDEAVLTADQATKFRNLANNIDQVATGGETNYNSKVEVTTNADANEIARKVVQNQKKEERRKATRKTVSV